MIQRIARIVLVLMLCSSVGYCAVPNSGVPSSSMWSNFNGAFTRFTDYFKQKQGTSGSSGSSTSVSSVGGCVGSNTCLLAAYALKQIICNNVAKASQKSDVKPEALDNIKKDALDKFSSECGDIKIIQGNDSVYVSINSMPGGSISASDKSKSPSDLIDDCIKSFKVYITPHVCGDGIYDKYKQCDPKWLGTCDGCDPATCQCPAPTGGDGIPISSTPVGSDTTTPTCPACPESPECSKPQECPKCTPFDCAQCIKCNAGPLGGG